MKTSRRNLALLRCLGGVCSLAIICALPLGATGIATRAQAEEGSVTYLEHIVPIFRAECFSCHNEDDPQGELDLTRYESLMAGGASGTVIDPGDARNSRLFALISHVDQPSMPPESPMIARESLELIRKWIDAGAANNAAREAIKKQPLPVDLGVFVPRDSPQGEGPMPPRLSQATGWHTERPPAALTLAVSATAPLLAVPGNRQIFLFHTETLKSLGRLSFPEGEIKTLQFSPDGTLLLAGGGESGRSGKVVLWRVDSGERLLELGEELDTVLAADISSDHRRLALGGPGGVVRLYEIPTGKLISRIEGHNDWIHAIRFSPDGVLLASGDRQGGLRITEAWSGAEYLPLDGHPGAITGLAWRADSNQLASADTDGFLRIWGAEKGKLLKKFRAHPTGVTALEAASETQWLTAGRDGLTRLWDAEGTALRTLPAVSMPVTAMAYCAVTNRCVSSGYQGEILVSDVQKGERLGLFDPNPLPLDRALASTEAAGKEALKETDSLQRERDHAARVHSQQTAQALVAKEGYRNAAAAHAEIEKTIHAARVQLRAVSMRIADQDLKISRSVTPGAEGDDGEKLKAKTSESRRIRADEIVQRKLLRQRSERLAGQLRELDRKLRFAEGLRQRRDQQVREAVQIRDRAQARLAVAIANKDQLLQRMAQLLDEITFAATIDALGKRQQLLLVRRDEDIERGADGGGGEESPSAVAQVQAGEGQSSSVTVDAQLKQVREQIRAVRGR
jgi:WD40 repeat protein